MDGHKTKIHKHNCSLLMKPAVERSCTGHSCTFKWITSDWSNVSYDLFLIIAFIPRVHNITASV